MKALSLTVVVLVLALAGTAGATHSLYSAPLQADCNVQTVKCSNANHWPFPLPITLKICINATNCKTIFDPLVASGGEIFLYASESDFIGAGACPFEPYCIVGPFSSAGRRNLQRAVLCALDAGTLDSPTNACTDLR